MKSEAKKVGDLPPRSQKALAVFPGRSIERHFVYPDRAWDTDTRKPIDALHLFDDIDKLLAEKIEYADDSSALTVCVF